MSGKGIGWRRAQALPLSLLAAALGRIFTVAGRVTTDAGSVRVSCVIKVSGRAVPALGHYAAHTAICQGIAPPGSAGKRLAGVMTVSIRGDRDARAFSFVIHR